MGKTKQMGGIKKKRDANFELLRVIAMGMVIALHYLYQSDSLIVLKEPLSAVKITGSLLEAFSIVSVNVWVLISGFYLSRSGFRLNRILQLLLEVYFYTLMVSLVMQLVGIYAVKADDSIFRSVQYLFPISSEHYWFATAYMMLYVLSPVLNCGIEKLTKVQLQATIFGLLLFTCLVKSFVPVNFVTDDRGYGVRWFLTLYLIGGYLRKYEVKFLSGKKRSLLLYVFSCLLSFCLLLVFYEWNWRADRFNYYFEALTHYNFILTLLGALGLFSFMRGVRLNEKGLVARASIRLSPYLFGVYLLQQHLEIKDRWIYWLEGILGKRPEQVLPFLGTFVLAIFLVFICGIAVDWVRKEIFDFLTRILGNTAVFRLIDRWSDRLSEEGAND